MILNSGFDELLIFVVIVFAIIGLVRGFLNELLSILNWFGSFYIVAKIKPYIEPLLEKKIQIPFLLDIILNTGLFILVSIIISVFGNFIIKIFKKFFPSTINYGLGFIFGLLKGILISYTIIAIMTIFYGKQKEQADFLKNSLIYTAVGNENNDFIKIVENILGDFAEIQNAHKTLEDFDNLKNKKIKKDNNKAEDTKDKNINVFNNIESLINSSKTNNLSKDDIESVVKNINVDF